MKRQHTTEPATETMNAKEGISEGSSSEDERSTERRKSSATPKKPGEEDAPATTGGKKGFTIAKIIAIVAIVLAILAVVLSGLLAQLWWYWPLCVSIPALTLAVVAIVVAFVLPNEKGVALCCAAISIILSVGAIAWCLTDLLACHSHQGPYQAIRFNADLMKYESELKTGKYPYLLEGTMLEEAYYYHTWGEFCNGACYDWYFKKQLLKDRHWCREKTEKWFVDKLLQDSVECVMDAKNEYRGVDTYFESPIYKTHEKIEERKLHRYHESEEESLRKELMDFCSNFNVEEFVKQRDECDEKMKEKFKLTCEVEEGTKDGTTEYSTGYYFEKNHTDWEILEIGSCGNVVNNGKESVKSEADYKIGKERLENEIVRLENEIESLRGTAGSTSDLAKLKERLDELKTWRRDFYSYYCQKKGEAGKSFCEREDKSTYSRKYVYQHTNQIALVEGRLKRVGKASKYQPSCIPSEAKIKALAAGRLPNGMIRPDHEGDES